jgi:hypothetical protein
MTELPLITKFNSNNVLYDALGYTYNKYISFTQDADFIYFLMDDVGTVVKYEISTETSETINLNTPDKIYSIISINGGIYGFGGYSVKKFTEDTVLYIKDNNKLVQESLDGQLKVTHLQSSSKIRDFILDEDMNYTVVHNTNKISKFTKDRILLYSFTVTPNVSSAFNQLSILPTNQINLLKIDYVREYTDVGLKQYPIILGYISDRTNTLSANEMFLGKINETDKLIDSVAFLGLTGKYYDFGDESKVNYNLTNYEYLKNKYTENDELRFKVVLQNVYNNRDLIKVSIPISTKYFTSEYHHFSFRVDGINGKISVLVDGKDIQTVDIQKGQYIFQELFDESINVGNTYFHNNISLSEYLNQPNYYYVDNAKLKQFKIYKRALTDNEIDFHVYNGSKMEDLVVSLPCGQRNELDGIDRQFKLDTIGSKSNSINIIIKNSQITNDFIKSKMRDVLIEKLTKVLPINTKINNIEFR